jgi:hypothetical protein
MFANIEMLLFINQSLSIDGLQIEFPAVNAGTSDSMFNAFFQAIQRCST